LSFGVFGSCDKTQALVDGAVTYGKQFVAAVRNGNVDVLVSMVEDLLPERCQRGSFELDYCAGYAVAALAITAVTGGSAAAAASTKLSRLAKAADKVVPDSVVAGARRGWLR